MPDGKAEANQVGRWPCESRKVASHQSRAVAASGQISPLVSMCTQILENCKRGQKKRILQSPREKQKRFCFWGCYLRVFLHT